MKNCEIIKSWAPLYTDIWKELDYCDYKDVFLDVVLESGFVDDNGLASTSISSCFYRAGGTGGRGAFSPTELSRLDPFPTKGGVEEGRTNYTHDITTCLPPSPRVSRLSTGFVFYATHNCMVIPGSRSAWWHSGKFNNYLDKRWNKQWSKNWSKYLETFFCA